MVAAVAAVAVFAAVALALAVTTHEAIESTHGEIVRARAKAAADAGFSIALNGLLLRDEASLAALDGRTREIELGGANIRIRLIDERGKVPVNQLDGPTVERLLHLAGVDGAALDVARDSLLDWLDADDDPRPNGAEAPDYETQGITPRNGSLASVDELARVRGFSPQLVARLRPILSVDPDAAPFDPSHADPTAIEVMSESGADSPSVIERERELSGQAVALTFTDPRTVLHRPITIAVDADEPDGGHAHSEATVELSGDSTQPYQIHGIGRAEK